MWDFIKWLFNSPAQVAIFLIAVAILVAVLRRSGFRYSKEGISFESANPRAGRRKEDVAAAGHHRRSSDLIYDRINELEAQLRQEMRKLVFYSNAPTIVRLQEGLEYVQAGGNGHMKANVRADAKKYPDEYAGVCALHPDLSKVLEEGGDQ